MLCSSNFPRVLLSRFPLILGADYIGSDGKLLTDGVIYPAQTKAPLPMLDSTDCSYYSCDHSEPQPIQHCGPR